MFYEGKALFVEWQLPCGFTIGARAAMVDPSQFDLGKGLEIARERAIDQLWQFESYRRSVDSYTRVSAPQVETQE